MKETLIQFPVKIKQFKHHLELKDKVLDAIRRQEICEHLKGPNNEIFRCDWKTSRFDMGREWLDIMGAQLYKHLDEWCATLGYAEAKIEDIWFQQYATNNKHSWHVHGYNFTNVYYLDLPTDSPKTEWIDPVTKNKYTFDVQEGDIITFPSWLIHRAPENFSKDIKTIISWNMDVQVTDFYGEENGNY